MTNFIQRYRTSGSKITSIALAVVLVSQLVLGSFVQAADSTISTEAFSDNSGITYSEVGGQPTGAGEFGNGAVAGYPEGACIPFFVELKNTMKGQNPTPVDIAITLVHDYYSNGIVGVTGLEAIAQNTGTLQTLKDANDLNDIAFGGSAVTTLTSLPLASSGTVTATVTGPYAGDEDDGTSPVTATDAKRHYIVVAEDIPVDGSAYLYFCGRLGLDASEYPGASLSIGVSPPSGGVENTAIATNQVLALPSITLTKEVVGGTASADEWSFDVSPSINGQSNFATTSVDANTASVTIENVSPDGAFTITESGPTGYPFTSGSGTNCSFNGSTATATVAAGDPATNATCVFTNTFDDTPPPPTTGTLTVEKVIVNDDGGTATLANFDFFIYNAPNQVVDVQSGVQVQEGAQNTLPPGTYWVSESGDAGYYTSTFSGACNGSPFVTLVAGQDLTCTITNDDAPATITVTKVVSGGTAQVSDFPLFVGQTQVTSGAATVIDAGSYTVSETNNQANYTASYSGDCDPQGGIALLPGDQKSCTVTNTFNAPPVQTGTITVVKVVDNEEGGDAEISDFPLFIGQTQVSSGVAETLPVGTYTVSETNNQANYVASFSGACDENGSVTLSVDQDLTCTITNTYVPPAPTTGDVTVTKIVINDDGGEAEVSDFILSVGQTVVTSGATNAFPEGFYVVSETGPTSGYTAVFSGDCDENGNITVSAGEPVNCIITNDDIEQEGGDETGTLTVVKIVINNDGGESQVSSFPLFINSSTTTSGTPNYLAPGQYVVSETSSPDYVASFSGDCDVNGVVNLEVGDTKTCTITNDDKAPTPPGGSAPATGSLVVVTIVNNDGGGEAMPASFLMTVGDGIATSSTFGGTATPGFAMSYAPGAYVVNGSMLPNYSQSKSANCSGTMMAGQTVTCVVTYTYQPAPTGGSPIPPAPPAPPAPQVLGVTDSATAPVPQVLGATDSDLPVTGMPAWILASALLAAAPFLRRKNA